MMVVHMEPLAITIAQAAKLGGPCRSALYKDIRAGRLRAVKRGRSTRILMEDFKAYLASFSPITPADIESAPARTSERRPMDNARPATTGSRGYIERRLK
jgi:excisionase family DNA binding protein